MSKSTHKLKNPTESLAMLESLGMTEKELSTEASTTRRDQTDKKPEHIHRNTRRTMLKGEPVTYAIAVRVAKKLGADVNDLFTTVDNPESFWSETKTGTETKITLEQDVVDLFPEAAMELLNPSYNNGPFSIIEDPVYGLEPEISMLEDETSAVLISDHDQQRIYNPDELYYCRDTASASAYPMNGDDLMAYFAKSSSKTEIYRDLSPSIQDDQSENPEDELRDLRDLRIGMRDVLTGSLDDHLAVSGIADKVSEIVETLRSKYKLHFLSCPIETFSIKCDAQNPSVAHVMYYQRHVLVLAPLVIKRVNVIHKAFRIYHMLSDSVRSTKQQPSQQSTGPSPTDLLH